MVIMNEFLTENGTLSREAQDPNSDAGVAWAKFHSVYPAIPKDALGDCTIESLMSKTAGECPRYNVTAVTNFS